MGKRQQQSLGSIPEQEGGGEGAPHSHSWGCVGCYLVILKENDPPTNCSVVTTPWFAPVLGLGSGSHQHRGRTFHHPRNSTTVTGKGSGSIVL